MSLNLICLSLTAIKFLTRKKLVINTMTSPGKRSRYLVCNF